MRVEIEGLNEVYSFLRNLPIKLEKNLTKTNKEFIKDVRRSASFKAPRSSNKLRKSFKIKHTKQKGKSDQWKLVSDSPYIYWVIHGRRPGRMPPIDEILKWKKLDPRKSGTTSKLVAAFNLAKWIGKHGTRPNDFINRAIEHNIVKWNERIEQSINEAMK